MDLQEVRRIIITASADGVQQTKQAIDQLAASQQNLATVSAQTDKATISVQKNLDSQLRRYSEEYRVTQDLIKVRETLRRAQAQGVDVSQQQQQQLFFGAARVMPQMLQQIGAGANGVRLARHEVANLSYQLTDVATGLASGQSPFMVMLQQGGQIADLLSGGGARSIGTGLRALGTGILSFITNPFTLATIAIAGAAAAATAFYSYLKGNTPSITDTISKHAEVVGRLRDAYGEAAKNSGKLGSESKPLVRFQTQGAVKDQIKALEAEINTTLSGGWTSSGIQTSLIRRIFPLSPKGFFNKNEFFQGEIDALSEALKKGTPDILKFREAIMMKGQELGLEDVAQGILKMTENAATAALQIKALKEQLDFLARMDTQEARRGVAFTRVGTDFQKKYEQPDMRDRRQQLKDDYDFAIRNAQSISQAAAVTKIYEQETARLNEKLKAQAELHDLNMRAIAAKTPEDKAAIAAERERISMIGEAISVEEQMLRIHRAKQQALTEANYTIAEENRQRQQAMVDNISQRQLEFNLIGKSVGEAERMRVEFQMIAEARRVSVERGQGGIIPPDELERIKEAARVLGEMAQQMAQIGLQRDVLFAREQLGRSPIDQQIASSLRSAGIDLNSQFGQWYADQVRLNEVIRQTQEVSRDALKGFLTDLRQGASLADALGNALDKFAAKLFDTAADNFINQLLGGMNQMQPSSGGGLTNWLAQLFTGGNFSGASKPNMMMPSYGPQPGLSAPVPVQLVGPAGGPVFGSGMGTGIGPLSPAATGGLAGMMGGNGVRSQVWNFWANKGLAPHQIAGIMGNVQVESGFNPNAFGDNGNAFGLYQHNGPRRRALWNFAGTQRPTIQQQNEFAWREFQTTERSSWARLKSAGNVNEATNAFLGFERPGVPHLNERLKAAQNALAMSAEHVSTSTARFSTKFDSSLTTLASKTGETGTNFTSSLTQNLSNLSKNIGGTPLPTAATGGAAAGAGGGLFDFLGKILGGIFGLFEKGGTIGAANDNLTMADPNIFRGAKHFRMGGSLGPNAMPIIGHRGERVWNVEDNRSLVNAINLASERSMHSRGEGTTKLDVNIVNQHPGAHIEKREVPDGRGGRRQEVVIREAVSDSLHSTKVARTNRYLYGNEKRLATG